MTQLCDVVVVGGGPAGTAVAGALAQLGRTVTLFERGTYDRPRVGETIGAEVESPLRSLGAWDAVAELLGRELPCVAVRSAWGAGELIERSAMLRPHGAGWHVNRAGLDGGLARWAASRGVDVRTAAGTCSAGRVGGAFRVTPAHGDSADGRYFVDASGRGAPAGRGLAERRWLGCDRQVAIVARMGRAASGLGGELLLEAVEGGWWYSAPQAGGELAVVLVTDSDLVAGGSREQRFASGLAMTSHTAARARGLERLDRVRVIRADSGRMVPDGAVGWCAVGDAAFGIDPLAGAGLFEALRGALDASTRIDRELDGAPHAPSDLEERFRRYLDRRAAYYELEERWPDAPFWRRRRPGRWREAPITLHPNAILLRADAANSRALASAEALLPPSTIVSVLGETARPRPAHELLTVLAADAPLGDRRLLLGLQRLIDLGVLAVR